MSMLGSCLSEDQFTCSICLDLFTKPVSTPCGHSFCLACISSYWDGQAKSCCCPLCKESFRKRPELHVNHTLREITEQFKRLSVSAEAANFNANANANAHAGAERQRPAVPPRPVELPGGLLSEMRSRFQRSVSVSTSSPPPYSTHSPPPASGQRRFTTSTGGGYSDAPPCPRHGHALELFCRTDQMCVCAACMEEDHYTHSAVPIKKEWLIKKSQLGITQTELQELISLRERKVEEIKAALAQIQAEAEQETECTVSVFSALVGALQRSQAELLEVVDTARQGAELRAQTLICELEEEISELRKRNSALAELAQSTDPIVFLRTFPSVCSLSETKSWADVCLTPDPSAGAVLRNITQLMERLQEELKRLPEICSHSPVEKTVERHQPKVKRVQEYAVDVTLDQNSAHPRLVISEDGRQVRCGDRYLPLPDTPERFDRVVCVLGLQGFRTGRHYWEVHVGGKTDWDLGVASHSINRKGKIAVSPANGYWFLSLRDGQEYAFRTDPSTPLTLNPRPHRIGIYLDYDKGQLSFYNADAHMHIFTYMDSFSDTIHPFFSPCTNKSGQNEASLIICPVSPTV
ncbi:E3 ubiquitin-protein ligase TRIM39 [Chanos chanos]|uniref:E3 ubiquitin-protein ligase TRIM39 n=1 Tax=Chanos chanos TaxID=29144 RepID=A0A6J2WF54_CHACN|nr:E3 ubiquitin-protein ligase TRIM39-like [Chanos chanos]